jgi:hypothetical protein
VKRLTRRHLQWAPLVVFPAAIAALALHFASAQPPVMTEDVDVRVVTSAAGGHPTVGGQAPRGGVDATTIDPVNFTFSGWADFHGGASLVLVTTGVDHLSDSRIRVRSLERPDVVTALNDRDLKYSGFSVSGVRATWGTPRCLYLRWRSGARVAWKADGAVCT